MSFLLSLSKYIDALNERIGLSISWALLLAVLICSGNAIVRYAFNTSSNAWLEIQWYMFGAMILLVIVVVIVFWRKQYLARTAR